MTESPTSSLDYAAMAMGLVGGLALFLFGMRNLTDSLKTVAGGRMKKLLGKLTTNRFTAAIAGAMVTTVIQSSSVTTVLVVGFVSAGLMTLSQSVGVILGANIGTTITAQIIAFKVTQYALLMITAGFVVELVSKRPIARHYASMVIGLGLLFLGMDIMSDATAPLRTHPPFLALMQQMRNPLLGIAVGAVFTALVQSSSATTGIVIVLATQGLIPLEAGIALVFGSNIGTCVTALVSAIGKPREALQTAMVHVLFNVLGVLLWVAFIPQFADLVRELSPASEHLDGLHRLAADAPRQIANAHTLFNIGNALLFIWFTPWIGRLATLIIKPSKTPEKDTPYDQHLDPYYLQTPTTALDQVCLALKDMGLTCIDMVKRGFVAALSGSKEELDALSEKDNEVDQTHTKILDFLARLSLRDMVAPQPSRILEYISIANYLENVGDVVETGLTRMGRTRIEQGLVVFGETKERFEALIAIATEAIESAVDLIPSSEPQRPGRLLDSKREFTNRLEDFRTHLAQRMSAPEPLRIETFRLETEMLDTIRRVYNLAHRIAWATIKAMDVTRSS